MNVNVYSSGTTISTWYPHTETSLIQATIKSERELVKDGDEYLQMSFESGGNQMRGKYNYAELESRLRKIREAIDEETQSWAAKGAKSFENHERVAMNLQSQFDQCQQHFSTNPNGVTLTLEMEKDNPFVWTMVSLHPSGTDG